MTTYQLYGRPGSGSFAVQVALEEIGVPFERIWVGREAADVARFRQVNPTGKVPALGLPDGTLMFESAAMLIHLAQAHPKSQLAPQSGTGLHARFLQWMVFLSANVYEAALRMYYSARYSTDGARSADAICKQGKTDFVTHLSLINQSLGPYVLGTEYSIADVYLYMLASWWPEDKPKLYAQLPNLGAHAILLAGRSTLAKVAADHAV